MELCLLKFIKKYSSFTKKELCMDPNTTRILNLYLKNLRFYPLSPKLNLSAYSLCSTTSFSNIWLTNEERRAEEMHHCILRNNNLLYVPFVRLSTLSKHPLVNLSKTWLDFNNENIKILRNKIEFKAELKKYL